MWIVGTMSESEKKILAGRGWEVEGCGALGLSGSLSCIFVDSDAITAMDGPEWTGGGEAGSGSLRQKWRDAVAQDKTDLEFGDWIALDPAARP